MLELRAVEAAEDAQQFFQRTTGHLFPAPTSGSSRLLIIQNPTPTLDSQGTHTAIIFFNLGYYISGSF